MGLIDDLAVENGKHIKTIKGVRKILDGVNLFSRTPEKDKAETCDKINEFLESEGF